MTATEIRILDPRAYAVKQAGVAPPLETLRGAVVAILWNNRPRGDRILHGLAADLEQRYAVRTIFRQKLRVGTGAPPELIASIAEEASAAIAGVGD